MIGWPRIFRKMTFEVESIVACRLEDRFVHVSLISRRFKSRLDILNVLPRVRSFLENKHVFADLGRSS